MWKTRYGTLTTEQIIKQAVSRFPEFSADENDAPLIEYVMDKYFGITTFNEYSTAQEKKDCPSLETVRRCRMRVWKRK